MLLIFSCYTLRSQTADSSSPTVALQHDYLRTGSSSSWHITGLEYKRQTPAGAFLSRVNRGSRFGSSGWQLEGEAYPVLSKKVYAYLALGFSPDVPVFPEWRSGASLYVALPKGWEAEGGFRHLRFFANTWIVTGGLSKYAGRWLLNAKAFISPDRLASSRSYFLTARRYFRNEADFAWLQAGSGVSPDESLNVLFNQKSRRITAGFRATVWSGTQLLLAAGLLKNGFASGPDVSQLSASLGLGYRFAKQPSLPR